MIFKPHPVSALLALMMLAPGLAQATVTSAIPNVVAAGGTLERAPGYHEVELTVGQPIVGMVWNSSKEVDIGFQQAFGWLLVRAPEADALPRTFFLSSPTPNPSRSTVAIHFGTPRRTQVSLCLYDPTGRLVRDLLRREVDAGLHEVFLDPKGMAAGVYFCRMQADDFRQTERLLMLH